MYKILLLIFFPYYSCAISGGTSAQSSELYPFSVTLTNPIICGASIISLNPPWVLTAAHCIEGFDIKNEKTPSLGYGSNEFSKLSYSLIKRAIPHPMYISDDVQAQTEVYTYDKMNSVAYDIALIELTEPFVKSNYVDRARLYVEQDKDNADGKNVDNILEAIGMGYTGTGEATASVLQYAECNLSNATPLYNNNFNDSVILVASSAGLCHGDSGSPLLYKSKKTEQEYSLKGVLNRILNAYDPEPENRSCPKHEDNISTFVNVFAKPSKHINWITSVTGLSREELTDTATASQNRNVLSNSSVTSGAQPYCGDKMISILLLLPLSFLLII